MAFSLTENSKNPCNIITYKYVKNPRPIAKTDDVYNPNTTDVGFVKQSLTFVNGTVLDTQGRYWYLNIMDVLGPSKIISFNRMRMKIQYGDTITDGNFILKAILYKLTSDAKIGDYSTYNNSVKVVESDDITITELDRIANLEELIDFVFPISTDISAYDGTTENHYFMGLQIEYTGSGTEDLNINVSSIGLNVTGTGHGSYINNFIFSNADNTTLGDTIVYANGDGFFPYYTLWNYNTP